MEGCNWLFVEEFARLHSLVTLWKIVNSGRPPQLAEKFELGEDRTLETRKPRLLTTEAYFKWRTKTIGMSSLSTSETTHS